jgi:hypothetical protein
MSSTESTQPTTESGTKKRSPALMIGIIVAVVVVLAGGAYVVYKLTNKHEITPAMVTAKAVFVDLQKGNPDQARPDSTAAGLAALKKISADDVKGLAFGGCKPFPGSQPTRLCIWSRPGGQLSMAMIRKGDAYVVDNAQVGPAGLPPATDTTTSSTT